MDDVSVQEVTLESLSARLDAYEAASLNRDNQLGLQMNWLCENLQSLFVFVQQVGQNGGGIRGMMQAIRHAPPDLKQQVGEAISE